MLQVLAVLCNKSFRKTIIKLAQKRETHSSDCSSDRGEKLESERKEINASLSSGLFSDLFDNITKLVIFTKTLMKILLSTSMFYLTQPTESNHKKTKFTSNHIEELSSKFCFPFIDKSKI